MPYIELGGVVDCLGGHGHPQAGQALSAHDDVPDGDIDTEEEVQKDDPDQIVDEKFCIFM